MLGALEPAEAEAFRRHIAECAACQKEVAAFEQVTGALPDAGAAYEVPRELRRRVMREVRATPKAEAARAETPRAPRRSLAWGGALAARRGGGGPRGRAHRGGSSTRTIQAASAAPSSGSPAATPT